MTRVIQLETEWQQEHQNQTTRYLCSQSQEEMVASRGQNPGFHDRLHQPFPGWKLLGQIHSQHRSQRRRQQARTRPPSATSKWLAHQVTRGLRWAPEIKEAPLTTTDSHPAFSIPRGTPGKFSGQDWEKQYPRRLVLEEMHSCWC